MQRPAKRRDKQRVKANNVVCIGRMGGKKQVRRADQPLLLMRGNRAGRQIARRPRLNLDNRQRSPTNGDDVNFAKPCFKTTGDNPVSFKAQRPASRRLGPQPFAIAGERARCHQGMYSSKAVPNRGLTD